MRSCLRTNGFLAESTVHQSLFFKVFPGGEKSDFSLHFPPLDGAVAVHPETMWARQLRATPVCQVNKRGSLAIWGLGRTECADFGPQIESMTAFSSKMRFLCYIRAAIRLFLSCFALLCFAFLWIEGAGLKCMQALRLHFLQNIVWYAACFARCCLASFSSEGLAKEGT